MAVATAYRHSLLRDFGLLLARVAIGAIFIAHGSQKIWEWTLGGTAQSFADMGVPFSAIVGPAVAILEFAGGIALILGLFTPWVGVALAINMAVAAFIAHVPKHPRPDAVVPKRCPSPPNPTLHHQQEGGPRNSAGPLLAATRSLLPPTSLIRPTRRPHAAVRCPGHSPGLRSPSRLPRPPPPYNNGGRSWATDASARIPT